MNTIDLSNIPRFEALRGNPVIFFAGALQDDTLIPLYECLRRLGTTKQLDIVLSTPGGVVTTSRRIAHLIHEFTDRLTILIPYKAKSAGTLLCLGAHELVMGRLSELGPIDASIAANEHKPSDTPSLISAQEILAFRELAQEWFGIDKYEDRLQVFALMSQRIFPTSLSSFFRADKLVRQIALELIEYQLPAEKESVRRRIVEQLVGGFHAHDYCITLSDARRLGLNVRCASADEELLMWAIQQSYVKLVEAQRKLPEQITCLIASAHFKALQISQEIDPQSLPVEMQSQSKGTRDTRWEISQE